MSKITQQIAQQIINEFCQGSSSYELANKYELWQTSICNLISGRTWKNCNRPENIKQVIQQRHTKGWMKKGHNDYIHQTYPDMNELQKNVILGSLLGDGHLHKTSEKHPNSNFYKQQCVKYKQYVDWHQITMSPFSKTIIPQYSNQKMMCDKNGLIYRLNVERYLSSYSIRTCSHPMFTQLRNKWYPQGKKIVPLDLKLTPLMIAIWFCDDGHNNYKNREATFCTQSFTISEAKFLCNLLEEFDIKSRVRIKISTKTGIEQPLIKMNSDSYDNLINLIKPHVIWDCMSHKILHREAIWSGTAKLSDQQVSEIFQMGGKYKQYEIAERYGVHKNAISALLRGDSYKHLQHLNHYIPKSIRRKINV